MRSGSWRAPGRRRSTTPPVRRVVRAPHKSFAQAYGASLAAAFLLTAVLAPVCARASDNNEDPPYMIYIDPETGKYTTKDPDARRPTDYDAQADALPRAASARRAAPSGPAARKIDQSGAFVAAALLVLSLGAAAWRFRRRRGGRALGGR